MLPRTATRRRAGMTLIELTIVILIIGILTATASPRYFDSLSAYRLESAANRLANDLRYARQYARKSSKVQAVQFNITAESYTMPNTPGLDRPDAAYSVSLAGSQYGVNIHTADFGGSASMQFDIFGRPNQSGTVVVKTGSQQRTVEVNSAGEIRTY